MPEWLIGALCSAPIWLIAGMFIFSLCTVSSWADEQQARPEDKDIDPT